MTNNANYVSDLAGMRVPIKFAFPADMIALAGNTLEDHDSLRSVSIYITNCQVFKRDGIMTPAAFFHGGPVNGWRIR